MRRSNFVFRNLLTSGKAQTDGPSIEIDIVNDASEEEIDLVNSLIPHENMLGELRQRRIFSKFKMPKRIKIRLEPKPLESYLARVYNYGFLIQTTVMISFFVMMKHIKLVAESQ